MYNLHCAARDTHFSAFILFWFLVSGMAIIKKRFFCCAIVLRGIRTSVLLLSRARVNVGGIW